MCAPGLLTAFEDDRLEPIRHYSRAINPKGAAARSGSSSRAVDRFESFIYRHRFNIHRFLDCVAVAHTQDQEAYSEKTAAWLANPSTAWVEDSLSGAADIST
jgi:hypothetical protein